MQARVALFVLFVVTLNARLGFMRRLQDAMADMQQLQQRSLDSELEEVRGLKAAVTIAETDASCEKERRVRRVFVCFIDLSVSSI
jgi:hypothetical protein